ncbi:hypothetical protein GPA00_04475 [Streptococcus equinus]|uniref:hypothetical protein n=1 Tax=Streptococcus TaxID=1301 RepID=UPI0012FA96C3|nr:MULTISPECIES: hypothetical protein [Streptococcus]MBT0945603.1 hypothetical protein [Streptococcus lutetiensis]QGX46373.1 hypothetical protein GPA00_04475 [Streptococcus equinus]
MENKKIIKWLNYCDSQNIKPWLWDFKNCYSDDLSTNNLCNILKYKSYELIKPTEFCVTGKSGKDADCDKEAFYLYQMLGWQNSVKDIIRGESMNSFITTFNEAIKDSSDYGTLSKVLGIKEKERHISYSTLYQSQNYLIFDNIQNNLDDFQKFATLTHTIGNFTVLPSWMNTGRYYFSRDYWDITLLSLQEWLNILSPDAWTNFVKTYYLQPYVNTEYNVELFWEGHDKKILPKKENYPVFLKKVNERIEERGKYMIKQICNKLNKTDFNFYTDLETMDRIKFSNEL